MSQTNHLRGFSSVPSKGGYCGSEALEAVIVKFAHFPMICSNATSLCIVKDWGSAGFFDDIVFGVFQIRFFLLPEKVDMEFSHEWGKLIVNLLKDLRLFFERIHKTIFEIRNFAWQGEANNFL